MFCIEPNIGGRFVYKRSTSFYFPNRAGNSRERIKIKD